METKKIKIVTEIEVEYNPDLIELDNIVCELDYSFSIAEHQQDVAEIKKTEIIDWN